MIMNYELQRKRTEAIVAHFKALSEQLSEESAVRTAGFGAQNRTRNLPRTKTEC
jgi:hypothetical protein